MAGHLLPRSTWATLARPAPRAALGGFFLATAAALIGLSAYGGPVFDALFLASSSAACPKGPRWKPGTPLGARNAVMPFESAARRYALWNPGTGS